MYCHGCGRQYADTASNCPFCGKAALKRRTGAGAAQERRTRSPEGSQTMLGAPGMYQPSLQVEAPPEVPATTAPSTGDFEPGEAAHDSDGEGEERIKRMRRFKSDAPDSPDRTFLRRPRLSQTAIGTFSPGQSESSVGSGPRRRPGQSAAAVASVAEISAVPEGMIDAPTGLVLPSLDELHGGPPEDAVVRDTSAVRQESRVQESTVEDFKPQPPEDVPPIPEAANAPAAFAEAIDERELGEQPLLVSEDDDGEASFGIPEDALDEEESSEGLNDDEDDEDDEDVPAFFEDLEDGMPFDDEDDEEEEMMMTLTTGGRDTTLEGIPSARPQATKPQKESQLSDTAVTDEDEQDEDEEDEDVEDEVPQSNRKKLFAMVALALAVVTGGLVFMTMGGPTPQHAAPKGALAANFVPSSSDVLMGIRFQEFRGQRLFYERVKEPIEMSNPVLRLMVKRGVISTAEIEAAVVAWRLEDHPPRQVIALHPRTDLVTLKEGVAKLLGRDKPSRKHVFGGLTFYGRRHLVGVSPLGDLLAVSGPATAEDVSRVYAGRSPSITTASAMAHAVEAVDPDAMFWVTMKVTPVSRTFLNKHFRIPEESLITGDVLAVSVTLAEGFRVRLVGVFPSEARTAKVKNFFDTLPEQLKAMLEDLLEKAERGSVIEILKSAKVEVADKQIVIEFTLREEHVATFGPRVLAFLANEPQPGD